MAKQGRKLVSWIFVFHAIIGAIVVTSQSGAVRSPDPRGLSPVILSGEAPALAVDPIVRRSAI